MTKTKQLCILLLRLLALAATVIATIVMVTSHEKTNFLGLALEAKYSHTPTFKYFVIANVIGSLYGLLVLFLPHESLLWPLVVALDVIVTTLLTSSISAALAIAYVGKKGNSYAGWQPICGQVHKYCDHVSIALASGFLAVLIYLILVLHSIYSILNPISLAKN